MPGSRLAKVMPDRTLTPADGSRRVINAGTGSPGPSASTRDPCAEASPTDQPRTRSFTGSAGTAVVTPTAAHLFVDTRYWVQAGKEIDGDLWTLEKLGQKDVKNWNEWILTVRRLHRAYLEEPELRSHSIGSGSSTREARLASTPPSSTTVRSTRSRDSLRHKQGVLTPTVIETGRKLSEQTGEHGLELVFPQDNVVDRIWHDRPERTHEPINIHPLKFTGESQPALRRIRMQSLTL